MAYALKRFCLLATTLTCFTDATALDIVTTIKPLHSIIANVTVGISEPVLLIDKQVSAHHYKLSPRDRLAIANADVIYWVGQGIESGFSQSLLDNEKAVSVLDSDHLIKHTLRETHGSHQQHGRRDHGSEAVDAHIWLSTENALLIAVMVSEQLSNLDAGNAAQYRRNLSIFADKLRALNTRLQAQYDRVSQYAFATLHDAFQYTEKQFGLAHVANISLHPTLPLSGKQRLHIDKTIRNGNIKCVFYDPAHHPKAAQQLASQQHVRLQSLDPLGYTLKAGSDLYIDLLGNLAKDIRGCLVQ